MARWGVSVRSDVGGVQTFNTFQMDDITDGGGVFTNRAERVFVSWTNSISATVTSDAVLRNVEVRSLDGTVVEEFSGTSPGAQGGNSLPVNCGVNFIKRTALGRNGRMFIAGFSEEAVSPSGELTSATRDAAEGVFQLFYDDLIVKKLQMTKDPLTPGSFPVNVTGISCGAYIVRQSRRLDRARY